MARSRRRRGQGEGSVYQRADGRWYGSVDLGVVGGRRRRKTVSAKTRNETLAKLRRLQREVEEGRAVLDDRLTLGRWLDEWMESVLDVRVSTGDLRASTSRSYRQHVRDYLKPLLGAERLTRLAPPHVRRLHRSLIEGGLSATTVVRVHATLRKALADAEQQGLVSQNVASKVKPPRENRPEIEPLTVEDAKRLLGAVEGTRHEALYTVMLMMGLRVGEVLGLAWEDVDLEARTLRIRRQVQRERGKLRFSLPKSDRSRRTLAMPDLVVESLRGHERRQKKERLRAIVWADHGLVFPSQVGTPMEPRNLQRHWHGLRRRLELQGVRPHLRHSYASFLLAYRRSDAGSHGDARSLEHDADREHVHPCA